MIRHYPVEIRQPNRRGALVTGCCESLIILASLLGPWLLREQYLSSRMGWLRSTPVGGEGYRQRSTRLTITSRNLIVARFMTALYFVPQSLVSYGIMTPRI